MTRAPLLVAVGLLVLIVLDAAVAPARMHSMRSGIATAKACRVPSLQGLTVSVARSRAAKAGCHLRLRGARITESSIQTVERQRPAHGGLAPLVTVTVNPLCERSGLPGPPSGEPFVKSGPTELVSGLYLQGGPVVLFSAPGCAHRGGIPRAGTITVSQRNGGPVVASASVTHGQLAKIPLAPGSYTITGRFADGTKTFPQDVVVPAGKTVRQDVLVGLP